MILGVGANSPKEWRELARRVAVALHGLHLLTPGNAVTIEKDHVVTIYHLLNNAEPPDEYAFAVTTPRAP